MLTIRGSGFAEFWISAVGSWIGLGGLFFVRGTNSTKKEPRSPQFSHPTSLYFYITTATTILLFPMFLLTWLNPTLFRAHIPIMIVPATLTIIVLLTTLLSNYLVRRAKWKESQRIQRMITDAAARERIGDESSAMAALGLQNGVWGSFVVFVLGVIGFVAGLAGLLVVIVRLLLICHPWKPDC